MLALVVKDGTAGVRPRLLHLREKGVHSTDTPDTKTVPA